MVTPEQDRHGVLETARPVAPAAEVRAHPDLNTSLFPGTRPSGVPVAAGPRVRERSHRIGGVIDDLIFGATVGAAGAFIVTGGQSPRGLIITGAAAVITGALSAILSSER